GAIPASPRPRVPSDASRLNEDGELVSHSLGVHEAKGAPLLGVSPSKIEEPRFRKVAALADHAACRQALLLAGEDQVVPVDVGRQIPFARTLERIAAAAAAPVHGQRSLASGLGMVQN